MSSAYETAQPFAVVCTLRVTSEDSEIEHINATAQSAVHWEKHVKKMLIHKCDPHNQKGIGKDVLGRLNWLR